MVSRLLILLGIGILSARTQLVEDQEFTDTANIGTTQYYFVAPFTGTAYVGLRRQSSFAFNDSHVILCQLSSSLNVCPSAPTKDTLSFSVIGNVEYWVGVGATDESFQFALSYCMSAPCSFTEDCPGSNCNNHGGCVAGSCTCDVYWTGFSCSTSYGVPDVTTLLGWMIAVIIIVPLLVLIIPIVIIAVLAFCVLGANKGSRRSRSAVSMTPSTTPAVSAVPVVTVQSTVAYPPGTQSAQQFQPQPYYSSPAENPPAYNPPAYNPPTYDSPAYYQPAEPTAPSYVSPPSSSYNY